MFVTQCLRLTNCANVIVDLDFIYYLALSGPLSLCGMKSLSVHVQFKRYNLAELKLQTAKKSRLTTGRLKT